MKKALLELATVCTIALMAAGCNRQESVSPAAEESSQTRQRLEALKSSAGEAAAELKASARQAASEVKESAGRIKADVAVGASNAVVAARPAVAALQVEADELLEKARTFAEEQRVAEAWNNIKELSKFQLTPEQQRAAADLKAQLQSMSSRAVTNATSSLNQLLGR